MKVEVYGIPETAWRCAGCKMVTNLLDQNDVPYTFHSVVQDSPDQPHPILCRPAIVTLAKRMKLTSLAIRYPVIFVDDMQVDYPNLKSILDSAGYDVY